MLEPTVVYVQASKCLPRPPACTRSTNHAYSAFTVGAFHVAAKAYDVLDLVDLDAAPGAYTAAVLGSSAGVLQLTIAATEAVEHASDNDVAVMAQGEAVAALREVIELLNVGNEAGQRRGATTADAVRVMAAWLLSRGL